MTHQPLASKSLVEGLLDGRQPQDALAALEACWDSVKEDPDFVELRFRALRQLGDFGAIECFLSAMPDDEVANALRKLHEGSQLAHSGSVLAAAELLAEVRPSGSRSIDSKVNHLRGNCETRVGDYDAARRSYGHALSAYEAMSSYQSVARCLIDLSEAERLAGRNKIAVAFLNQAIRTADEHSYPVERAKAHQNLGSYRLGVGHLRSAYGHYQKAAALFGERGGVGWESLSRLGFGCVQMRRGMLAAAQESILRALQLNRLANDMRTRAIIHEYLGELRLCQGKFKSAALHLARASRIGKTIRDPEVCLEVSYRAAEADLALLRPEVAETKAIEAREGFKTLGNRIEAAVATRIVAQIHICQRKWREANTELQAALATFEELDEQFEIHRVRRLLEAAKHKAPVHDIRAAERPKWGVNIITKSKTTGVSTLEEPEIICGHSHRFLQFLADVDRGAKSTVPILLEGETGTGKELVAQRIHARSNRHAGPFVAFNCGTSNPELFDGEVFGHLKGSFTGAATDRKGLARTAHNGTLFLDEIGEMTKATQARMLRLLDSGEVRPVGSDEVVRTDLRLISATHQDLDTMIEKNEFRQDLFYRLATIRLRVPPLRERIEDLELLFQHFRDEAARKGAGAPLGISDSVLQKMADYPWPGNVRELRNSVHRLAGIFNGSLITTWWPNRDRHQTSTRDKISKDEMIDLLWETEGSVTRVSDRLEVSRPVIYRLLRQWGLDVNDFRSRRRS